MYQSINSDSEQQNQYNDAQGMIVKILNVFVVHKSTTMMLWFLLLLLGLMVLLMVWKLDFSSQDQGADRHIYKKVDFNKYWKYHRPIGLYNLSLNNQLIII